MGRYSCLRNHGVTPSSLHGHTSEGDDTGVVESVPLANPDRKAGVDVGSKVVRTCDVGGVPFNRSEPTSRSSATPRSLPSGRHLSTGCLSATHPRPGPTSDTSTPGLLSRYSGRRPRSPRTQGTTRRTTGFGLPVFPPCHPLPNSWTFLTWRPLECKAVEKTR